MLVQAVKWMDEKVLDILRLPERIPSFNFMLSLNSALKVLDKEFDSLLASGVDAMSPEVFSAAWQALGPHRDQVLLSLARKARGAHRRRAAEGQAAQTTQDLMVTLAPVCDFAFRYLGKRQIVFLIDATTLAFDADVMTQAIARAMGMCAGASPYATPGRIEAAVTGMAGIHRHNAERIAALDDMDTPKAA